jgi:LacI family transcriptional regulator
MTTIRDIAREAKVSIGIVSRILNEDALLCVKDDTRQRVLAVIQQCSYKPRPRQSSSTKKKTVIVTKKNIGLLLATPQQEEFNDPYYMAIREGIENQALESGLTIAKVIRANLGNVDMSPMDLDGLIVVGNIDYKDLRNIFPDLGPIVFVDRTPQNSNFDAVISDLGKAMKNVLDYLFTLGHKNIDFIGGRECFCKINSADQPVECEEVRLMTYKKIMLDKGIGDLGAIFIGDWTSAGGYEVMKKVINTGRLPSAIIVGNDLMSIGVLRALYEGNIRVPQDVAIVSFDDTPAAAYLYPPLTTVKLYTEEMGRRAVLVLLERMQGRTLPLQVAIPSKLIVRESCGGQPDEHCEYIL